VLDTAWVLAFVAIGRASHAHGDSLSGLASTSWPFLIGLGSGWIAVKAWRRPTALVPTGLVVWLATVAVGMVLRVASGQGTALAFVLVALAFVGLGLLGWRGLVEMASSRWPKR
jgi:FtsH-binding integral membrane protein